MSGRRQMSGSALEKSHFEAFGAFFANQAFRLLAFRKSLRQNAPMSGSEMFWKRSKRRRVRGQAFRVAWCDAASTYRSQGPLPVR
jgi:hypothetical protein